MTILRKLTMGTVAAAAAATLLSSPASAQRDPAYAAARANGTVGEQTDGYLGVVGEATPALRDMVNDINIKRRAVYTERARSNQATLEAYAVTAGCQAIARTVPGEKYQGPDGTWKTRTSAPPERLSICP
jgi:uncharacterized protein YdbL (DUF1318 family)